MFTITDIRDIAVQIERNGEKAYRQASQEVSDPEIAELFSWMADEERRHAEWFETIKSKKPLTEDQMELEKMGRQLLQEMVAGKTFSLEQEQLQQVRTFQEMIAQSKSFEQDTILFYEFLRSVIDDDDAGKQLNAIIAEEQAHVEQLEALEEADDGICISA